MKQKFDFILDDRSSYHRDIFRFYPRRTHVHGFTDEPPKVWKEAYKVYYSWAIIRQYYDEEGRVKEHIMLLDMPTDECSQIPNLPMIIEYVMKTGEEFDDFTFGQPAGDWTIKQNNRYSTMDLLAENDKCYYEYYDFQVFNNSTNQGYRFRLNKEKTIEFCKWLKVINQYALDHSEGI